MTTMWCVYVNTERDARLGTGSLAGAMAWCDRDNYAPVRWLVYDDALRSVGPWRVAERQNRGYTIRPLASSLFAGEQQRPSRHLSS